jgi:hypothetical protein
VANTLAAAEQDAYEGRLASAIQRLEAVSTHSDDVADALARYHSAMAERERRREAEGPAAPLIAHVRQQVGQAKDAIAGGRWSAACDLLISLEREMGRGPAPPRDIQGSDELSLYLTLARQHLQAGDVAAALSLIEAALGAGGEER